MVVNVSLPTVSAPGLLRMGDAARIPLPWSVGDTVALEVGAREGGEVLLLSPQGVVLRVPAAGSLADLTPGTLLLMRVLATEPALQLQQLQRLSGTAAFPPGLPDATPDAVVEFEAMREGPRLSVSSGPALDWDAPALAADWRARLQLLLERGAPSGVLPWAARPPGAGDAEPLEPRWAAMWPWPLACYAPGGWRLYLGLRRRAARQRRGNGQAASDELHLTLHLPTLGQLSLRLMQGPMGLDVCFDVERQSLAEQLEQQRADVAEALQRLGMALHTLTVGPLRGSTEYPNAGSPGLPSFMVFQAGAELLAQIARLETVSPAPPRY